MKRWIPPLTVRLTARTFLPYLFLVAAVVYLAIGLALTLGAPRELVPSNYAYGRVLGYSDDLWFAKGGEIHDPYIAHASVQTAWNFDAWRPDGQRAIVYFEHHSGRTADLLVVPETPIEIRPESFTSSLRDFIEPLSYTFTAINPFRADDDRTLSVKFGRVSLRPTMLLFLPAISGTWGVLLMVYSLVLLAGFLTWHHATQTVRVWPMIVTLSLSIGILSMYDPDRWVRAIPLWVLSALLLLGMSLYNRIAEVEPVIRATTAVRKRSLDWITAGLFVVLLAGGAIRLYGMNFGLPNYFHPDEARKSSIVAGIVQTGDLHPRYFRHPSFLLYSAAALAKGYEKIAGRTIQPPDAAFFGRMVSVILGTFTIVVVFLLGRELYNRKVGLIAATLVAVSPLHVVCSRYMKEDVSFIFFALLSALFCARAVKTRKVSYLLLTGLIAGVSFSTKYTGLLTLYFVGLPAGLAFLRLCSIWVGRVVPAIRTMLEDWSDVAEAKRLLLFFPVAIVCFVAGFLAITPYSVIDSKSFLYDFEGEGRHMEMGHNFAISAASRFWMYHFENSLWEGMSPIATAFAIVACGYLLWRRRAADLFILSAVLLFYLPPEWVKAKPEPQPERYILPCIPLLGIALGSLYTILQERGRAAGVRFLVPSMLALAVCAPLATSVFQSLGIVSDTRAEAVKWIMSELPHGSKILVDWDYYSGKLPPGNFEVVNLRPLGKCGSLAVKCYRAMDADYLVLSSFTYERYFKYSEGRDTRKNVYRLFAEFPVIKTFEKPFAYGFHNPTLKILALREPRVASLPKNGDGAM